MNQITKYWFLLDFDFSKKLGKPYLMSLCEELEMVYINKGSKISINEKNQNRILFLKKGSAKIVKTQKNFVKYIINENSIFGELERSKTFTEENSEHAVALEDCVICYIESEKMNTLVQEHESLKNTIIKMQRFRIKKLETRIEDLIFKNSESRIKEFIISFIKEYGKESGTSLIAKNTLNHTDIGHLTNTSRQTVNNTLSKLRKEGLISYDSKLVSMPKTLE